MGAQRFPTIPTWGPKAPEALKKAIVDAKSSSNRILAVHVDTLDADWALQSRINNNIVDHAFNLVLFYHKNM